MQQRLFDFLDELKERSSADDAGRHFVSFAQHLGATGAHIWFADGTPQEPRFRVANISTYSSEGLRAVDDETGDAKLRLPQEVARGHQPIRSGWDIDARRFEKGSADYRASQAHLAFDRRRNALIVPIPTRGKYGTSGISIYSDMPEEPFDRWLAERGVLLIHAAGAAHLAMQGHERRAEEYRLSPRELACLRALSEGLRTKEIAWRLGLSSSAVMLYLNNARRKMKVDTREALVAKAFRAGLIG